MFAFYVMLILCALALASYYSKNIIISFIFSFLFLVACVCIVIYLH